jgi:pilus assembly protein CpaC
MTREVLQPCRVGVRWARIAAAIAISSGGLALAAEAWAAPSPVTAVSPAETIRIDIDKAYTLTLADPATMVFVANPAIADVQANDPRRVVIYGHKSGATTIYVTSKGGQVSAYLVNVGPPLGPVQAAIEAARAPSNTPPLVSANPRGLTVAGQVDTPRQAAALKAAASQHLDEKGALNFAVGVVGGTQVNLQVRIAEVSRQVSRQFGFNWNAIMNNGSMAVGLLTGRDPVTGGLGGFNRDPSLDQLSSLGLGYRSPGGSANISALIDALQSDGLITILAEPNLTATSGEQASFLAGGEFPIPVSTGLNQVTVEWKHFGVSLGFTPTVLDGGRISVKVSPEVSELSDNGAVVINNIKVPAIAVRRAETTVELASGQSFAIAGLYQNSASNSVDQLPWLGNVPILGALFRSTSFKHNQSELVIIVTPYIVRPAAREADLRAPTDNLVFANDLEQILMGRVTSKSTTSPSPQPHLLGPAGFSQEERH